MFWRRKSPKGEEPLTFAYDGKEPLIVAYASGGSGGSGGGGAGGVAIVRKYGAHYVAETTTTEHYDDYLMHHDPDEALCPYNHEPMDCTCEYIKAARKDQARKDMQTVLKVTGYYPSVSITEGVYTQEEMDRIVDYVVATCAEQIQYAAGIGTEE
jgi:hypothetical protein